MQDVDTEGVPIEELSKTRQQAGAVSLLIKIGHKVQLQSPCACSFTCLRSLTMTGYYCSAHSSWTSMPQFSSIASLQLDPCLSQCYA